MRPAAEGRGLVVEEDAAVLDRGLAAHVAPGRDVERGAVADGHVGPPVPGRDADLLREVVDAEDRAALVAAGDDQGAVDARPRPLDDLDERGLPAAADLADVELAGLDEPLDQAAPAQRADDDGRAARGRALDAAPAGCRSRARRPAAGPRPRGARRRGPAGRRRSARRRRSPRAGRRRGSGRRRRTVFGRARAPRGWHRGSTAAEPRSTRATRRRAPEKLVRQAAQGADEGAVGMGILVHIGVEYLPIWERTEAAPASPHSRPASPSRDVMVSGCGAVAGPLLAGGSARFAPASLGPNC